MNGIWKRIKEDFLPKLKKAAKVALRILVVILVNIIKAVIIGSKAVVIGSRAVFTAACAAIRFVWRLPIWKNQVFRTTASLFLITAVTGIMLSMVNSVTAEPIAQIAEQARADAKKQVMPFADSFPDVDYELPQSVNSFSFAYQEGRLIGYVVAVEVVGYGGTISMVVGLNIQNEVSGVAITKMSETPGLGTKAGEASFLNQFTGKSGGVQLGAAGGDIEAISGATLSSRAVTDGVNAAIALVNSFIYEKGGV